MPTLNSWFSHRQIPDLKTAKKFVYLEKNFEPELKSA